MPLFDLTPKDTPKTLFGRERELDELVRLVDAGRWVVLLGPRMVGKTSLLKAANHRFDRPSIYVNLWGARGTLGFVNAFVHGLNSSRSVLTRLRGAIRRIEGVSLGPGGISVTAPHRPLRTVWDLLDVIGHEAGRSVIEFDEVQEVAQASGSILRILGNLFNTHPEVVFVFSGSRFGVIRTLLEPPGSSPLFGRPPATVRLGPFDRDTSVAFLARGLKEYRRDVAEPRLQEVVDRTLDGIPGWLTLFGNHLTVERMSLEQAERATVHEARRVVRTELGHFLAGRDARTYWTALRVVAGGASWTEVREALSARRGTPVNDNTVRNLLRTLAYASVVEETEGRYRIADPMVREFVQSSNRPPVMKAD
ncbi:MAG TPA: ATP-binding protein [Thermoplasmata archaeon]|nr:ATP-binding protein [Thermoplasmata archaeon]